MAAVPDDCRGWCLSLEGPLPGPKLIPGVLLANPVELAAAWG